MISAAELRLKLHGTLIAVVVEGGAEAAVIDILLDNNLLFFSRDDIFNGEVINERPGVKIETKLQGFNLDGQKISILRIKDSKSEKYFPSLWGKKNLIDENGDPLVFDIITAPEIEMLYLRRWRIPAVRKICQLPEKNLQSLQAKHFLQGETFQREKK